MNMTIKLDDPLEQSTYSIKCLSRAVSEVFSVEHDLLLSKRRIGYVSQARSVLYYLGYTNTVHSTTTLGDYLGRDHTTILYGMKKCRETMDKNNSFAYKVEEAHVQAIKYEVDRQDGLEKIRAEVEEMVNRIKMERLNGL